MKDSRIVNLGHFGGQPWHDVPHGVMVSTERGGGAPTWAIGPREVLEVWTPSKGEPQPEDVFEIATLAGLERPPAARHGASGLWHLGKGMWAQVAPLHCPQCAVLGSAEQQRRGQALKQAISALTARHTEPKQGGDS